MLNVKKSHLLIFNVNLTWNKHNEYINCKLNRRIGVLRKIRKFKQEQEKTFKNKFNAFLTPYLEYRTLVQSGALQKHI